MKNYYVTVTKNSNMMFSDTRLLDQVSFAIKADGPVSANKQAHKTAHGIFPSPVPDEHCDLVVHVEEIMQKPSWMERAMTLLGRGN